VIDPEQFRAAEAARTFVQALEPLHVVAVEQDRAAHSALNAQAARTGTQSMLEPNVRRLVAAGSG
jgi:hypothetical protein